MATPHGRVAANGLLPIVETVYFGTPSNWRENYSITYTYNASTQVTNEVRYAFNNLLSTTTYQYDARGNQTRRIVTASTSDTIITTYEYDSQGRMTSVINIENYVGTNPTTIYTNTYNFFYVGPILDSVVTEVQVGIPAQSNYVQKLKIKHNAANRLIGYRVTTFDIMRPGTLSLLSEDVSDIRLGNGLSTLTAADFYNNNRNEDQEPIFIETGKGLTYNYTTRVLDSVKFLGTKTGRRIVEVTQLKAAGQPNWSDNRETIFETTTNGHRLETKYSSNLSTPRPDVYWQRFTNTYDTQDNRTEVIEETVGDATFTRRVFSNFITTTAKKSSSKLQLTIYPNPSNGTLYIKGNTKAIPYKLTNTLRHTCLQGQAEPNQAISTRGLNPGLYTLETTEGTLKVIVQ